MYTNYLSLSNLSKMAGLFGSENREVVRIKVKKHDGLLQPEYKKLCVDPQLTSFDILMSLLGRAFNIKGEFTVSYLSHNNSGQDSYLSMLSDWDLDAAFLSASDPCLLLKVDLKPFEEGLDDWDIVAENDQNQSGFSSMLLGPEKASLLGSITGSISNSVGKTVSHVSKAMGLKSEETNQPIKSIKAPMTDTEFHNYLDNIGHLVRPQEFRLSVYQGTVDPALRTVAWRHLLNIFPENMSGRQRFEYLKAKSNEYYELREQWRKLFTGGEPTEEVKFVKNLVMKDVLRTDRTQEFYAGADDNKNVISLFNLLVTYAMTHPQISYCQGMSDLASPLLVVQKDEAYAYMCFCGLMNRMRSNFLLDGAAMTYKFQHLKLLLQHNDLVFYNYLQQQDAGDMLFCYRWILLEVKREFPFADALQVLEVMWSSLPPAPPGDEGLQLTDQSYHAHPSPQSPTTPSYTFQRVQAIKQNISNSSETDKDVKSTLKPVDTAAVADAAAITPVDEQKATGFLPVANDQTIELIERVHSIDISLSQPTQSTQQADNDEISKNTSSQNLETGKSANSDAAETKFPFSSKEQDDQRDSVLNTTNDSIESGSDGHPSIDFIKVNDNLPPLPPPQEIGHDNPFLLFLCLTLLLQQRDHIVNNQLDYNELAMHFDRMVRKHRVENVLYQARLLYSGYLKTQAQNAMNQNTKEKSSDGVNV